MTQIGEIKQQLKQTDNITPPIDTTIGKLKIKQQLMAQAYTTNIINTLLSTKQWKQITKSNIWNLKEGDWCKKKAEEVFKIADIIEAKQIKIGLNNQPNIIKSLVDIFYPNMIDIYLNGNNISTIQQIHLVKFDNLRRLKLSDNLINSLLPLRKMRVPKLSSLDLCKNYIVEPDILFEIEASTLKVLWLESYEYRIYNQGIISAQQEGDGFLKFTLSEFRIYVQQITLRVRKSKKDRQRGRIQLEEEISKSTSHK